MRGILGLLLLVGLVVGAVFLMTSALESDRHECVVSQAGAREC